MRFGVMFFAASPGGGAEETYRTMLEVARLADAGGLSAVWTPERHFDEFGGVFPNPALTSAALATVTQRLQLRAGSLISPLHHTVRVAEEWSVVDNLSSGRAAVSFGAGWNTNDFVLCPDRYADRRATMLEQVDTVRRLWRGESVELVNGTGHPTEVRLYPKPVQRELPVWLTSSGNPQTFIDAGAAGANLLTHLIGQDLDQLRDKIALYRKARADHGHQPQGGLVSLMLHTHLDADGGTAELRSRGPFREYLRSAVVLERKSATGGGTISGGHQIPDEEIPGDLIDELVDVTYERYLRQGSLIGSPAECAPMVDRLARIGVDEVACLLDFGLTGSEILGGIEPLIELAATFS
ncbi:MupA/Atu3671 family FMN-dependent luciferase-like monooxygenase [Streptomyces sp. CBMA123]|uniref:MupA/Atu3671 family FMN-dependent luciferase-like monooxygenase n=1 Tax=Streptomyces sp. CBMA123 TaxID=1896313 RepID=UPI001661D978|nr:MupA/Atu3671 family FMN-dependent luciferase-like monooxygenase [Streptomyces sp. CBMA123]MBD0688852.1 monooxygenase [Streptomyces sp. CBMA123]